MPLWGFSNGTKKKEKKKTGENFHSRRWVYKNKSSCTYKAKTKTKTKS